MCAVVALVACKHPEPTDLPICLSEVLGDEATEAEAGQLPPEVWFQVLLRDYSRKTGLVADPLRDCSGRRLTADEGQLPPATGACAAAAPRGRAIPERPLTPDDLVIVPVQGARSLVWIKARHYDNGDVLGPIAVTEWTARGVAVRAIGSLFAQGNRARLRLEPFGAGQILVVESDLCSDAEHQDCERVMRLVPLEGDRFVERPLLLEDGTCLGPATFELHRVHTVKLSAGVERKFELTRTVDFDEAQAVMTETVVIKDRDPREPDAPEAMFRNATVRRSLVLTQTGLTTSPGLWEQMLAEHGSVSLDTGR